MTDDWFYKLPNLSKQDPVLAELIKKELEREEFGLQMIPSENFVSPALLEALGSILTNKYAEGYPKKRYYSGFEFVDQIETIAIERAKKAFNVPHANVQPYSGSPANFAIYLATCTPGDTIMGLNLPDGGHLTHGWKTSVSGMFYKSVPYHVKENGYIDMDEVRTLALSHKPKLIWVGATAYPREIDFAAFGKIADEVGAYLAADVSHITGLILAGVHQSPVDYAHIIMTTTHKTLRGPRGAMLLVTQKGLEKDAELADKIDKAVFPGAQGGPHEHQIAATAVALGEAMKPEFKAHGAQIIQNA
ncbi:MAG: serine hydroxymethyltransferase, partial [Candidatus Aenigmatarchaeota archaeon]